MKKILAFLILILPIAACGGPPTPDISAVHTQAAEIIYATQTASAPKATDTPTATATPSPTDTATPTLLPPTPTATDTPIPTVAPTDTPISTPTPVPPTPTPKGPDGTRQSPLPMGPEGTIYDDDTGATLGVTITQMVRGDEAWQRIQAANMFNDPPSAGNEYMLIYVVIHYLKATGGKTYTAWLDADIEYLDSGGRLLSSAGVVEPEPSLRDAPDIYEGGTAEGWYSFEVPAGDNSLLVAFDLGYRGQGGLWFTLE